jgi:hypothetical protein
METVGGSATGSVSLLGCVLHMGFFPFSRGACESTRRTPTTEKQRTNEPSKHVADRLERPGVNTVARSNTIEPLGGRKSG